MNDHVTPSKQWQQLKEQYKLENLKSLDDTTFEEKQIILSTIKSIDENTPWQEFEPKWWCEMIDFYNLLC
jgi:hypothetical protein